MSTVMTYRVRVMGTNMVSHCLVNRNCSFVQIGHTSIEKVERRRPRAMVTKCLQNGNVRYSTEVLLLAVSMVKYIIRVFYIPFERYPGV